ncbi:hypothetical protein BDF14DRAFT_1999052 [Spinellus fusiger]|nr:hypothetical protein BDF14DRAFT_1999052 [Spinellus fusiger]
MSAPKINVDNYQTLESIFMDLVASGQRMVWEKCQEQKTTGFYVKRNQEQKRLEKEMEKWIKHTLQITSHNITVNGEECADALDLDTEPLDLTLDERTKEMERRVLEMREKLALERRLLLGRMDQLWETALDWQQVAMQKTPIDRLPLDETPPPPPPSVSSDALEEYKVGMKLLRNLYKTLPMRLAQYEDLERTLQSKASHDTTPPKD